MEIWQWGEYFSEQRSLIVWEKWEWETDAAGIFLLGLGNVQQVVTVRSYIHK